MRRFYAPKENFQDKAVLLSLEETRHLRDVLRLREGENAQVFDGDGREFLCEIEKIGKLETSLKILEEILPPALDSNLDLTLAVALLKGEKFDLVVQKAVELGVKTFIPVLSQRTDVKIKDSKKKLERWRRISLEAAKQSGRAGLMKIDSPVDFQELLNLSASPRLSGETYILFAERGGEDFSKIKGTKKITAVIGSEGGWEMSEIEAARKKGFQIVTLKGRILRAETAAVSIAAILQHRFGDLN